MYSSIVRGRLDDAPAARADAARDARFDNACASFLIRPSARLPHRPLRHSFLVPSAAAQQPILYFVSSICRTGSVPMSDNALYEELKVRLRAEGLLFPFSPLVPPSC